MWWGFTVGYNRVDEHFDSLSFGFTGGCLCTRKCFAVAVGILGVLGWFWINGSAAGVPVPVVPLTRTSVAHLYPPPWTR